MKKLKLPIKMIDLAVIVVTISAVGFGVLHQIDRRDNAVACHLPGKRHEITIKDDAFSQPSLSVRQCDVILVVNRDNAPYQLAFGTKDSHMDYPGFRSLIIGKDESIAIDAIEAGSYELHDHLRDRAKLQLTIQTLSDR